MVGPYGLKDVKRPRRALEPPVRVWYTDGARSAIRAALEMEGFGASVEGAGAGNAAAGSSAAEAAARIASSGEALLPAYLCDTLLGPFYQHGLQVRYYDVGPDLSINLEDLSRRLGQQTRVLLFIHYFGFPQPEPVLRFLAGLRPVLIEDLTHAVWTEWPVTPASPTGESRTEGSPPRIAPGAIGDYVVASYRKFGEPFDGGFLRTQDEGGRGSEGMRPPALATWASPAHCLSALAWSLERSLDSTQSPAGVGDRATHLARSLWRSAEAHYDRDRAARAMSPGSRRLLEQLDVAALMTRRRQAYGHALRQVQGCPHGEPLWPELPEGVCPLVLPMRAHTADERGPLRAWLARRGLSSVLLWPRAPGVEPREFPGAAEAVTRLASVLLPMAPGENRAL
ncbi:MAG: hypothetical protein M1602_01735 [Firmicutes bacterium]|nr:hypothetical protein [Bacillota bacterium]